MKVDFSMDKHVQAQMKVDEAKAKLEKDSAQLKATKVYATEDGTVLDVNLAAGQRVEASTLLLKLARPATARVVASLPHSSALRVRYGQACEITVQGSPQRHFRGVVARFLDSGASDRPAVLEVLAPTEQLALAQVPVGTPSLVTIHTG